MSLSHVLSIPTTKRRYLKPLYDLQSEEVVGVRKDSGYRTIHPAENLRNVFKAAQMVGNRKINQQFNVTGKS